MEVDFQILDSTVCNTLYCIAGRKNMPNFAFKNKDLAWGHYASLGLMLQTKYVLHSIIPQCPGWVSYPSMGVLCH